MCNRQLGFNEGQLTDMLRYIRNIFNDDSFVQQIMEINQNIYNIGQVEE